MMKEDLNRLSFLVQSDHNDIPFHLLELADPSRERIEQYLQTGECTVAYLDNAAIGVVVLDKKADKIIEIKNIAIAPKCQGQGFGKVLLQKAIDISISKHFKKLRVGTGNSSIGQLAFYQKAGFDIIEIQLNHFIKHYDQSIFENGIQCKHLIVLEKELF